MFRPTVAALLVALSLAACSKAPPPPPPLPPTGAVGSPDTPLGAPAAGSEKGKAEAAVSAISVDLGTALGDDGKMVARGTSFRPEMAVIAAVTLVGSNVPTHATVTARWKGPDGSVVKEESQSNSYAGESMVNFRMADAQGLRKGNYLLEVAIDGSTVQTRSFSID